MNFDEDNLNNEDDDEFSEDSNFSNLKVDDLIKKSIDLRKIKIIDKTKKRAALESVFDERTIYQLGKILEKGILDYVEGIISAGKEANVYLGYDFDGKEIAIKIYKIDRNTSKWMKNYIIGDPRFKKIPNNISKIIYLWATKEFKNLKRAFNSNLSVPEPIFVSSNILLMEYIGFGQIPAPKLKDIKELTNKKNLVDEILSFIKDLYQKAKLVHGDLSEFNILYHNQKSVIIDISQAVSVHHPKAEIFLVRDIKNIFNYFNKFNLDLPDPEKFYYNIIS